MPHVVRAGQDVDPHSKQYVYSTAGGYCIVFLPVENGTLVVPLRHQVDHQRCPACEWVRSLAFAALVVVPACPRAFQGLRSSTA
eukprot:COSAG01_NODE_22748_length_842_cov_3.897712_1_plen_83_part_10